MPIVIVCICTYVLVFICFCIMLSSRCCQRLMVLGSWNCCDIFTFQGARLFFLLFKEIRSKALHLFTFQGATFFFFLSFLYASLCVRGCLNSIFKEQIFSLFLFFALFTQLRPPHIHFSRNNFKEKPFLRYESSTLILYKELSSSLYLSKL